MISYCRSTVFKAFIGYLQTDCVSFAPLYPEIDSYVPDTLRISSIFPDDWSCSPSRSSSAANTISEADLSIELLHKFADAYNIEELVKLCETAYAELLLPEIALLELSDKFARTHPSILAVVEDYALENWVSADLRNYNGFS